VQHLELDGRFFGWTLGLWSRTVSFMARQSVAGTGWLVSRAGHEDIDIDVLLKHAIQLQWYGHFCISNMAAGRHLGFFMTKYVDYQIQDCVKFLDPNNVSISVAHFFEELLKISWYGSHLGRHLELPSYGSLLKRLPIQKLLLRV